MRSRHPLLAAVVGALLVGGATTGTTRASWSSSAGLAAGSVSSGAMAVTATAGPTSMVLAKGRSATTIVTLTDVSSAGAKNLVQRVVPTISGSLPSGVSAALTTHQGASCSTVPQGPVTTTPGASATTCLTVTVAGDAIASSAIVTVAVAGAQLQGGSPAGWTSAQQTVSVPVTIVTPPAAPVLSCHAPNQNGFRWNAVTGATGYVVTSSPTQTGAYSDGPIQTSTGYTPSGLAGQSTTFFRVRATGPGGGESPASNTIRLVRSGSNYSCAAVTP